MRPLQRNTAHLLNPVFLQLRRLLVLPGERVDVLPGPQPLPLLLLLLLLLLLCCGYAASADAQLVPLVQRTQH